ncbi:uncharacterized protein LOC114428309 isoform X3 [Parambassis ranga]|uniref:Uncharacterized protein LOC114428309 isoform X3 n=1 Tax=Parambassis ranga TaxID=210632 RepID=A0A6P7HAI5_9TELE|nr:uncharacterized protein LOC114428309 isoform X3 [Parambassis ranga]
MAVLGQILKFVLLFEGVSGERVFLYFRPGQDAILPCDRVSPEETQCSHISWYHQSDQTKAVFEGNQGKVCLTSARAARLRLVTGCSLIINNITAEDVGRYGCLSENTADDDSYVFLSVLTISSSAADADAQTDDRITLTCSLLRYLQVPLCPENSLQWVNETGAVLSGEGVGYELNGKKGCGSSLTVTRQSGQNRRYTCRFVERGSVKIDAEYTAVSTGTGVSGEDVFLYFRSGQDAILPCDRVSPEETQCSHIYWYHDSDQTKTVFEVNQGKVSQNSTRAARLRLVTGCSLIINNITAEDAGRYGCQSENTANDDSFVYLSVLTISSSAADADAQTDDRITLTCSLLRYLQVPLCPENSLQWVNETGAVLSGEGVGYELNGQKDCGSSLTVTRQSGQNRRYTCRFVERGSMKIDAEYTFPRQSETFIIVGAVGGALLVVLVVITAVLLLKYRKRAQTPNTDGAQKQSHHVEPEGGLTYVTVDHNNKNTSPEEKVEEKERVTYSTLRAPGEAEADDDPANVYSFIR